MRSGTNTSTSRLKGGVKVDVQYTIEGASFEVPLEVLDAQGVDDTWSIRGAYGVKTGDGRLRVVVEMERVR